MEERFVDTPAALADLAGDLAGAPWLAVDTEFLRERTYRPELCLIQVAGPDLAACVDPLALADLGPLRELLMNPATVKVFHAARQDLEIFLELWGELPGPVFDTQPAAALLGLGDQVGYGNLVQAVLGVDLPKDHSRTDWTHRPLDPAQRRYALDDVIYLGRLYVEMRNRLAELGRLDWLEDEFAALLDPAGYQVNPHDQWQRVKGWQKLRGVQLAILQALAAWREETALAENLPRRWVVKDDLLLELTRRAPGDEKALRRVRGVDDRLARRHGAALLDRIRQARALPRDQWPTGRRRAKPDPTLEATLDILSGALRLLAAEAGLSPQLIAGRRELQALAQGDPEAALRKGWRHRVAGAALEELLSGRRRLVGRDGRIAMEMIQQR